MGTFHDRLKLAVERDGRSLREISLAAGQPEDFLRGITRRTASSPSAERVALIERTLGLPVGWMMSNAPYPSRDEPANPAAMATEPAEEPGAADILPPAEPESFRPLAAVSLARLKRGLPDNMPVLGTAAGSVLNGDFEFQGGVVEFVRRPPALEEVFDAYAIYVVNGSMIPEHRPGALRFVDPNVPPRPGDSVVLQIKVAPDAPIEGYIAHLVRRSGSHVTVSKLNPPSEVRYPTQYVKAIHRVMETEDLFV